MAKTPIEELIVNLRTRYGNDNDLANEMILFASMALEEEKEKFVIFGKQVIFENSNWELGESEILAENHFNKKFGIV